mmetsp:Transcript_27058/g.89457  ORF Transcript_27058/g.89457 Transcript_27058/m.89457 type:complete len:432 (+) Transcript_27058:96-1391(+)
MGGSHKTHKCFCDLDGCNKTVQKLNTLNKACPNLDEAKAAGKEVQPPRESGTRTSGASGTGQRNATTDPGIHKAVAIYKEPLARVAAVVAIVDSAVNVAECVFPARGETPFAKGVREDTCATLNFVRQCVDKGELVEVPHWDCETHRKLKKERRDSEVPGSPDYNFGRNLVRKTWESAVVSCALVPNAVPRKVFHHVVACASDERVCAKDVPKTKVLPKALVKESLEAALATAPLVGGERVVFVQGNVPEKHMLAFLGETSPLLETVRCIDLAACTARVLDLAKSVEESDCPIATNASEQTALILGLKFLHRALSDAVHQARIANLWWTKVYALLKRKLGGDLDKILDGYLREGFKFPPRPPAADVTPWPRDAGAKKRKRKAAGQATTLDGWLAKAQPAKKRQTIVISDDSDDDSDDDSYKSDSDDSDFGA